MNKIHQELLNSLAELNEHKSEVDSLLASYKILLNSKNKNLKSAALKHFQRKLNDLLSLTEKFLDQIEKNNKFIPQGKLVGMEIIAEILENFDQYSAIYSKSIFSNNQINKDYFALLDRFLKIHKAMADEKPVIIFEDEGREKLLYKNLKGQIDYINKLSKDKENFTPENIKKTKERAKNIELILDQLTNKIEDGPNKEIFNKLFAEAYSDLQRLSIKISFEETDEISMAENIPPTVEHNLESLLKFTLEKQDKLQKQLKYLNNSLIYKFNLDRIAKVNEKLDMKIVEIKSELQNEHIPKLLDDLQGYIDKQIAEIDSNDTEQTTNTCKQIYTTIRTMLKSSAELLKTTTVYGHEDIEDDLINRYAELIDKLKELRALTLQKAEVQTQAKAGQSTEVQDWAKKAPETKKSEQQGEVESPRDLPKND